MARTKLRSACLSRFAKRFDPVSGQVYYEDQVGGQRLPRKPLLLGSDEDISLDEREEVQFREFNAKQAAKARLRLAFEERESKRRNDREALAAAEQQAAAEAIAAKWAVPFLQAERNGELVANWQGFTAVDPRVYEMAPRLVLLRLIGNPFKQLPDDLFSRFTRVTVLSLSNCELDRIPEGLTKMPCLEDLNLLRNRISALPESFGDLTGLTSLHIANNHLTALPESISRLQKLPRLNLEQNPIERLPESVSALRCRIVSWSKMSLHQLPSSLSQMAQTLVSLTADHNRIRRFPRGLGKLVNLRHLSLCDNRISVIPDDICDCQSLERLWLDWNMISELPPDFLKLDKLESIHLEGNPMKVPDMAIVVAGLPKLRAWFKDSVEFYREKERKDLVLHLQAVLATMYDEDMHQLEFYQAGCTTEAVGDVRDLHHAFVPSYLFDYVVPTWNSYVESLSRHPDVMERKLAEYAKQKRRAEKADLDELERLEKDMLESMEGIAKERDGGDSSDAENVTSKDASEDADTEGEAKEADAGAEKPQTSKTANVDPSGAKLDEEGEDDEDIFKVEIDIEDEEEEGGGETNDPLARRAKAEARKRRTTLLKQMEEGDRLEAKPDPSERLRRTKHELAKVPRSFLPFEYTQADVEDALEHFKDAFGSVVAYEQPAMFQLCGCMRDGEPRLCVPPNLDFRCSRSATLLKFAPVTYMEKLRRDSLNQEQVSLQAAMEVVDAAAEEYCNSEEGVSFFNALAREQARALLEKERQERFILARRLALERRRRKESLKRVARKARLNEQKAKRIQQLEEKRNKLVAVLERSKGWEAKEIRGKIADVDDDMENHPQDIEIELIERDAEMANERYRVQARAKNLLKKYKPRRELWQGLHELLTKAHARRTVLVREKLVQAHLHVERKYAAFDVRREYRITRRIMFNWLHLSVRMTFSAWREWVRGQVYWKKHLAMEAESQEALAKASAEVDRVYQKAEFAKWVRDVDPFSEREYWQHMETGQVRFEAPQLHECVFVPRSRVSLGASGAEAALSESSSSEALRGESVARDVSAASAEHEGSGWAGEHAHSEGLEPTDSLGHTEFQWNDSAHHWGPD